MSDTQSIKYRLIGAAVIVLSFVLAWWLLLDHDIKRHQGVDTSMPEPLKVERFDISTPQLPSEEIKAQPVKTVSVAKASKPEPVVEKPKPAVVEKKPATKPVVKKQEPAKATTTQTAQKKPAPAKTSYSKLNDQGLPEAWVLQMGSFKEKANAQQLQSKLLKHKYPAYVKAFNLPSGRIYRVLIGPKLSKQRASQMSREIQKKLKLQSMLVTFKPGFEE